MGTDFEAWLRRRIERMRSKVESNSRRYDGNESGYSFHGGFESGHSIGRLGALEDIADELGIDIDS